MRFGNWLGLIALLAALLLLWSLREALVLLFAAVVLAMALCTLVGTVRRRLACGRPLALVLSLLAVALLMAVVATAIIPPFMAEFAELLQKLPAAAAAINPSHWPNLKPQSSSASFGSSLLPLKPRSWQSA